MAKLVYLLCCCPRSGSTMFCETMSDTGVAGRPMQYFDPEPTKELRWRDELGILGEADYVDKILRRATSINDVAGIRLNWPQTDILARRLAANLGISGSHDHADLKALAERKFGHTPYIWLRRHNKVAQAISYFRAARSDVWTLFHDETRERQLNPPPVEFDAAGIDHELHALAAYDRAWAVFFLRQRIRPLMLVYEHFIQFRQKTIGDTLAFLGITDTPRLVDPRMKRQADDLSAEWEARYRKLRARELGGIPTET